MKIPSNWTFEDTEVAKNFNQHVREQLPFYDLATNAISHIARHYVPENGLVYDIGASTGNIGKNITGLLKDRKANLIALEKSAEMVKKYNCKVGKLINIDAIKYDFKPHTLAIFYLVLMFVPVSKRIELITKVYNQLIKGGAIIIFDKEINEGGYFGTVLYRLILANKIASRVSTEDVVAKELSLAGVQIPFNPKDYKEFKIKRWFKYGDFGGWIIEK
jgi:tRNA (cmo5U34)-methyltransferase